MHFSLVQIPFLTETFPGQWLTLAYSKFGISHYAMIIAMELLKTNVEIQIQI